MLTMRPTHIGVEPLFDPDMTESGLLYIPDQAKERCDQGIVKYVGGDCTYIKVGDHVLFSGYTGTLIEVSGEGRLILMPERAVVALVWDDPTLVEGVYFKDKDGNYFAAMHEQITFLIARALEKSPYVRPSTKRPKIDGRPKVEEYEETETGAIGYARDKSTD